MKTRKNMMIVDSVEVIIRDKSGNVKSRHKLNSKLVHRVLVKLGLQHNSIANVGMAAVARLTCGVAEDAFTYLAIGTSTTADNAAATALVAEVKRKAATCTVLQTTVANDTAQWVATFSSADTSPTANATDVINEIGVFNDATTGILLLKIAGSTNYGTADTCNWSTGDTYQLIVKCKIKQGA